MPPSSTADSSEPDAPELWAGAQINLGSLWASKPGGNPLAKTENAIRCFDKALTVFTAGEPRRSSMKQRFSTLSLLLVALLPASAAADALEQGRKLTVLFYAGDLDAVWQQMSAQMRSALGDAPALPLDW